MTNSHSLPSVTSCSIKIGTLSENCLIRYSLGVVSTKNRQVPVNRKSLTLFRNLEYRCAGIGMEGDGGVWGISLERFAETCRNQNRNSSGMRMFGKERPP